jgi:exonuclease SbcD
VLRVLHTADWHLGRPFHGDSLLAAHAAAIEHMVAVARDARVSAILIAGDLYDRALPPVDAVRLADEALCRLSEVAPVVVISGNHDSAPRLGFGASLFDRAGVHVRTAVSGIGSPVVLDGLSVFAIPYLEPDLVREELGAGDRGHGPVLEAAMDRVRAGLVPGARSVVLAHAFVAGASETSSERDLSVGGAASVPAAVFRGVDYAALGHLHPPQTVGSSAAYSGSPVAFSFSEVGHAKSVRVVDLEARSAEVVPVPLWRPLAVLRGSLASLLEDPALAVAESAWVSVTLTDAVRPEDAMERLRRRFVHAVLLAFEPEGETAGAGASYAQRHRGLSDTELVAGFVEDVRGAAATAEEAGLLEAAMTAGRVREASR